MDLWLKVLAIQAVICIICMLAGRLAFGLSLGGSLLAAALVTPVPLFKVSPGAAGFVYTADIVAVIYLFILILHLQRDPASKADRASLRLVSIGIFLLILWPIATTVLGMLSLSAPREPKTFALCMARGIGYISIFYMSIRQAKTERNADGYLVVQCIAFTLIAICGLTQYIAGVELDFWNRFIGIEIGNIGHLKSTTGFEAGFMGLYRGAVGAWGVGFLGIIPVVFCRRKASFLLIPGMSIIILLAIVCSGSRQGVVIGLIAFFMGLFYSIRSMPEGQRFRTFMRNSMGLIILMMSAMVIWSAYSSLDFKNFVNRRFSFGGSFDSAVELAANRDPLFDNVIHGLEDSAHLFLFGSGYAVPSDPTTQLDESTGFVYVDSEILSVWQTGGLVQIGLYALLLVGIRYRMRRRNWPTDTASRTSISATIVVLYSGILLTYGHFFIVTVFPHEAPIAYWTWGILGLGVGLASHREQLPEPMMTMDDGKTAAEEVALS